MVPGPARETYMIPRGGSRKYQGFMGTGLAHPKTGTFTRVTNRMKTSIPGMRMEPMGSMWRRGFNVRRRESLAVGSPSFHATYPWATSWGITLQMRAKTASNPSIARSIFFSRPHHDHLLFVHRERPRWRPFRLPQVSHLGIGHGDLCIISGLGMPGREFCRLL